MAVKFMFSEESYTPFSLRRMDEKAVRAEYSRLRSVAMKRINRLEASGFLKPSVAQARRQSFPTIATLRRQNGDKWQLGVRSALSDMFRFLKSEGSTVKGAKMERQRTLQNFSLYGIKWVNDSNFPMVIEFLERVKGGMYGAKVTSPLAVEYLASLNNEPETLEFLERGFIKWMRKEEKLSNKK